MLSRLIKTEFHHWPNAPWFFALVFLVPYILLARIEVNEYLRYRGGTDFSMTLGLVFPMLIIIGGSICAIGWAREHKYGATRTALTMPVSRRDFLTSKYISVFLGQLMFSGILILVPLAVYILDDFSWEVRNSILLIIGLVTIASGVSFVVTLKGRVIKGIVITALLIFVYHALLYATWHGAGGFEYLPSGILTLLMLGAFVFVPIYTWRYALKYFIQAKDIP